MHAKFKKLVIEPIVEEVVRAEYAHQPNLLEEKAIWQERIRKEIGDAISGEAIAARIQDGCDAISAELPFFLTETELTQIYDEWFAGMEFFLEQSTQSPASEQMLYQLMRISEQTLESFYEAGRRLFERKEYKKSGDAFFVLTVLDPRRYNVWLSLGLAEANTHHYDSALYSFGMASLNCADSPLPYLYAAECSFKINQEGDADEYLSLAKEAIKNSDPENHHLLQEYLHRIHKR